MLSQEPEEQPSGSEKAIESLRVTPQELTAALSAIDAREAQQANARIGTQTISEALIESGLEATPEELTQAVEQVRAADALEQDRQRRRRRLRLIFRSEIASALLCGLLLLGMHFTTFNPHWQAVRQKAEFQHDLNGASGPNPQIQAFIVPISSYSVVGDQVIATTNGPWAGRLTYPLYALPDGYNIYASNALFEDDDEYADDVMASPSSSSPQFSLYLAPLYFQFGNAEPSRSANVVYVYHEGQLYRRGWVDRDQRSNVLQGKGFTFISEPIMNPQVRQSRLVPLTLSVKTLRLRRNVQPQGENTISSFIQLSGGNITFPNGKVDLDNFAWETYPTSAGN